MKYYIDTCIWIDFIKDRLPTDIFVRCVQEEHIAIVSDMLLQELYDYLSREDVQMLMSILQSKGLLEHCKANANQDQEATVLSKDRMVPFGDALHAILSRDNDATLITRDKHFLKLIDVCVVELL